MALVDIRLYDIRDWAEGRHKVVDDRPFGGGPGMVLKVEPVVECVEAVQRRGAGSPGDANAARAKAEPADCRGAGRQAAATAPMWKV